MIWIQSGLGPVGEKLAYYVSAFGEEIIIIIILGFLYWCYDKKIAIKFGYSMLFANLCFPILKNIALRRRPYMDHAAIKCLKPVDPEVDVMDIYAQGYSFPSGHSCNAACTYGSLARFFSAKAFKIIALVIPFCVGFSRVALGNHYPTDVLAGWAIGYLGAFLLPVFTSKIKNRNRAYLIVFLACACGSFFCRSNDYFTGLGMMAGFFLTVVFEEKYVNFRPTRKPLECVLRILGGGALYFILNTLMKLPFSEEFLESATPAQFAFRFIRYTIIIFLDLGVYPMLFNLIDKKMQKKNA